MSTEATQKYEMVRGVHDTYQARLAETLAARADLERQLSRVNHEVHRLESHIGRMQDFCKEHEIDLKNKGEEN